MNHWATACDQYGVVVNGWPMEPQGSCNWPRTDLTYAFGVGVVMLGRRILDIAETYDAGYEVGEGHKEKSGRTTKKVLTS